MTFLWPHMLWLLAALPLLVAVYVAVVRRGRKAALAVPGLARSAPAGALRWQRHAPPALLLLGLMTLLLGAARPVAVMKLAGAYETVVLAVDVSVSMLAEDIAPSRLAAARSAAKDFVAAQPESVRIGLVQFGAFAIPAQPPGVRKELVLAALDQLQPQYGTAIGEAILVSLRAALPAGEVMEASARPLGPAPRTPHAAIILLTDGANTAGPSPQKAAAFAAAHGVRVYTVGVGTEAGGTVRGEGWATHVGLDEDTLREVARLTGAEYLRAESASQLKQVYEALRSRLTVETARTEVSALFSALGALSLLLGASLSVVRFSRIA